SIAHLTGDIYVPFDVENRSTPSFGSLDFYFNHSNVKILHSCNGLLLCYARRNHANGHYVFNPTTKQLEIIPSVPKGVCSMALAFHQTHCMHYKVVDLTPYENFFQIQVYSSDTRKWKICIDSYFESFYMPKPIFRHPVYWNGAVYWAPSTQNNLLYFKLDAEQLQVIPFPAEMMSYETSIMYFGESRGHLHLVFHTDDDEYILHVNVYEMMTDHSGWFVKYQLQLDALLRDFPCLISQYEMYDVFGEIMEYPWQCDFKVIDVNS
ncbi:F-box protein At5g07610-like, partial [Bidens hawaiensis]|uniref:F-box protein At5g07610-like n=1 Tax=Bidens hawaiensis TaxID=980011 RepID=UPI00404A2F1C